MLKTGSGKISHAEGRRRLRRSPLWAQWLAWVRERKLDIYLPPEALEASLVSREKKRSFRDPQPLAR
jgi:hypothetical protein